MVECFPGDPGVFVAALLNARTLQPGQAVYVEPGTVHAYVRGTGVEVMTNSDNVLRLGLTTKTVAVDAALAALDVDAQPHPCDPVEVAGVRTYAPPDAPFEVDLITDAGTSRDGRVVPGSSCACSGGVDVGGTALAPGDGRPADRGRSGRDACGSPGRRWWPGGLVDAVRQDGRVSTEGGTKAVLAALVANLGIAISKFVAFVLTGSSSMLSEAIHSVADSANQVLLLVGGKRAKRAADPTHQFGYARVRYVYAFVVSIVLFLVGGIFSLYEGFHKFTHPEELRDVGIAIGVLLIAIALEAFSFRTAMREANKSRGRRSLFQFVRDARQPELPVVLLEDSGALVGLVFALIGVGMATVTGDARWDGLGAMAVGTLLVVIAVFLAFEMSSMLVGESALPEQEAAIRAALADTGMIDRVIHLKTLHVGPDELLVAAKIAIGGDDDAGNIARGIDEAEVAIRAAVPSARYIYLEPDLDRSGSAPSEQP